MPELTPAYIIDQEQRSAAHYADKAIAYREANQPNEEAEALTLSKRHSDQAVRVAEMYGMGEANA